MEAYNWGSRVIFIPIAVTYLNLPLYMHVDGIEHVHLALYEISPCKTNGIPLEKFYCIF